MAVERAASLESHHANRYARRMPDGQRPALDPVRWRMVY